MIRQKIRTYLKWTFFRCVGRKFSEGALAKCGEALNFPRHVGLTFLAAGVATPAAVRFFAVPRRDKKKMNKATMPNEIVYKLWFVKQNF